jgi:hypothetical protein
MFCVPSCKGWLCCRHLLAVTLKHRDCLSSAAGGLLVVMHRSATETCGHLHSRPASSPKSHLLQVLEKARVGRLLGAALEARILLSVGDAELRGRLAALDAAANGADPLRYAFIVSQVGVGIPDGHACVTSDSGVDDMSLLHLALCGVAMYDMRCGPELVLAH